MAYNLGLLGRFESPSILPAAAGYFGVGIASRMVLAPLVGKITHSTAIAIVAALIIPMDRHALNPILIWSLIMVGLTGDRSTGFPTIFRGAFESRLSTYCGSRSYSVYLSHAPIIAICLALWHALLPEAGKAMTLIGLAAMVIPTTFGMAEIFHRLIEVPGIALGNHIARSITPPDPAKLAPHYHLLQPDQDHA